MLDLTLENVKKIMKLLGPEEAEFVQNLYENYILYYNLFYNMPEYWQPTIKNIGDFYARQNDKTDS